MPLRSAFPWALALFAAASAFADPIVVNYGPPADATPLGSTFVAWDSLKGKPSGAGESRPVFDNPTPCLDKFEMHVSTLLPGKSSHPPHQHPWEEMLFIKEGSVDVSLHGEKHPAGPGSLVFFASHDAHNATNNGTIPATYYVINFVPQRVHTVPNKPAVEQAVPGMQGSAVFDTDHQPQTATSTGSRSNVVDTPTLTFKRLSVHTTTLNAGQRTQPDMVDEGNELFIVRAGVLEATVNGVSCRLKGGSFFYCAPNDKRSLRALGGAPATYLVIKVVTDQSPAKS